MTATRSPIVIPPALAPLTMEKRWVIWRWVTLRNGKITKPPFKGWSPSSEASTTNPKTWCTFEVAQYAYEIGASDGVGYMLKPGEVGAFDIDHCIDSAGVIHPWARKLISR